MIFNKVGILHCVQDDEIEILRVVRESMRLLRRTKRECSEMGNVSKMRYDA